MRKLLLVMIMLGSMIIGLPVSGYSTAVKERTFTGVGKPQISIRVGQPRRRWRSNGRWYYGYRNYGQFRRTQVGNRRYGYRMYPEYYWDDGVRRVRYVRYYYNF
ncbi:MAG TPA: hypothetical protein VGQ55_11500 [Pyrinomonadaceae bacterium]|jgi:hypothetical protein|nr:hypothetical protein [Pyrinomonadaceae bacterium]